MILEEGSNLSEGGKRKGRKKETISSSGEGKKKKRKSLLPSRREKILHPQGGGKECRNLTSGKKEVYKGEGGKGVEEKIFAKGRRKKKGVANLEGKKQMKRKRGRGRDLLGRKKKGRHRGRRRPASSTSW